MLKRYNMLYLILISSLLLASCMHDPITNKSFKTPEPTAVKTRNGNWVAVVPNCQQRVCCEKWVCRHNNDNCGQRKGCGTPECRGPADLVIEKNIFGCATARNLGKMVSHPKDLVYPEKTRGYVVHNTQTNGQNSGQGSGANAVQNTSAIQY